VIGARSGMFSGRVLSGEALDELVQYMSTLHGSKGFADPGWLMAPYLLERKAPHIYEFRVLDVRSKEAYLAGHATNAVWVDPQDCITSPEEISQWPARLGITQTTVVVVYDELGNPRAVGVWWRVRRAGHSYAAVLDGGWRQWEAEGRFTTSVVHVPSYPHLQRSQRQRPS
jgi:3-mercaptopyruvate sulfurtransferase SseA